MAEIKIKVKVEVEVEVKVETKINWGKVSQKADFNWIDMVDQFRYLNSD